MSTTLKDIAAVCGYSVNTVSRALRGDKRISARTREVIRKTAEEKHYIPDAIASSMRSLHSRIIGVITADSSNPFFNEVNQGIVSAAAEAGYHILIGSHEENVDKEMELVRMFLSRRVDGLIVMPVSETSAEHLSFYRDLEVPFVFPGRYLPSIEAHAILHGDIAGEKNVFDFLLSRGHRKILYLAGPRKVSNSFDRRRGMASSLEAHGLSLNPTLTLETTGKIEDGYSRMNEALNRGLEFTAVACFNDLAAMGVLKSLSENGLQVPGDVEVVGFDNLYMSQFMQPALSTVDVPKFRLGQVAMEILVSHIENPALPYEKKELPTRLVLRETTRQ